ncbi:peptidylprolyl isomerase [Candidatus Woesearchaeota archaeon]|nr:peptidylprolyl isomerase [Candidatus Woesearchaeota archaeon]
MKKIMIIVLLLVVLAACKNETPKEAETKMKIAVIETGKGVIKAELYTDKAPVTTKNFIELANSGFYNGLTFHRVEPGFVVQGGDPKGDGTGGSEKTIPLETSPELKHVKGALGMARSQDPNSASSQFYITLAPTPFLDGNYAVFGKVLEGMEIAEKINAGDKMNKVYIVEK